METEKRFNKKYTYNQIDELCCVELCDAINALPGIRISCVGSGKDQAMHIFFNVYNSKKGLFFLTRCVDKRYWRYGNIWRIELSVSDLMHGRHLPITYMLTSGTAVGQDAYDQALSLVENMNYHLNHVNFKKGYGLKYEDFDLEDELKRDRREKLKKLYDKFSFD